MHEIVEVNGSLATTSIVGRSPSPSQQLFDLFVHDWNSLVVSNSPPPAVLNQANTAQLITNISTNEVCSLFGGWISTTIKADNDGYIQSVYSQLQAISLESEDGELILGIQKLLGPFSTDSLLQLLKFAVYLSTNNMLSNDQIDHFL